MRVVLDSNVLVGRDWLLRSKASVVLLAESAQERWIDVVVPEVVLQEVVAAHGRRTTKALSQFVRAREQLANLGFSPEERDAPFPASEYEATLRAILDVANASIAPLPEVALSALLGRALRHRRPFDEEGHDGFRDTLVWETVLDLIRANPEPLALVSNDKKAFQDPEGGDEPRLHPHLIEDLETVARAEPLHFDDPAAGRQLVELHFDLADFIRTRIDPALEAISNLGRRLEVDADYRRALLDQLVDAARVATATWAGVDPAELGFSGGRADWVGIDDPRNPRVITVVPFAGNEAYLELEASADARVLVELPAGVGVPPGVVVPKEQSLWVERNNPVTGHTELVIPLLVTARVIFTYEATYSLDNSDVEDPMVMGWDFGDIVRVIYTPSD